MPPTKIRYFCTCGRGTENFFVVELNEKLSNISEVLETDGKVWFCLEEPSTHIAKKLFEMKCCERLFVAVLQDGNVLLHNYEQAVRQIRAILQRQGQLEWLTCLSAWKVLSQIELERYEQEQNTDYETMKTCTQEKKACSAGLASPSSFDDHNNTSVQTNFNQNSIKCNNGEINLAGLCREKRSNDEVVEENAKRFKSNKDNYAAVAVNEKPFIESGEKASMTFRVSSKCSGAAARLFTAQSLSSLIGPMISRVTGWTINLKKPSLEIYTQLNHAGLVIGLSANRKPLSKRLYLRNSGMRTTIAAIMASLADLQPGMQVLDPMCGQGTILIESVKRHPDCVFYGCDIDEEQCDKAEDNVRFSHESHRVHILRGNVACLALRDGQFDAIICDIPFGNKHGTFSVNKLLYPTIVSTINRLLKPNGKVVLLVGSQLKNTLLSIVESLYQETKEKECYGIDSKEINTIQFPVKQLSDGEAVRSVRGNDARRDCTGSCSDNLFRPSEQSCWTTDLIHYVKLGESDAYICVFCKKTA